MKKFGVVVALLIVVVICFYWFKPRENGSVQGSNQLVVGMTAGYAPFVSINPAGEYEGFDIDVARALAKQMGKELVLQDLGSMTSLFAALDSGKIDTIIWGVSITDTRLQKVAMVHYFGDNTKSYPLLFWQKIPSNVQSVSDLDGQTVCVEPGSSQQAVLDQYPAINQLPVEKIDDALLNIQYGKAVAALVEPAIAKKFQSHYSQIQILDLPLAPGDQVKGIGIVIKPTNQTLFTQITNAIQCLKADGVIDNFAQKWGVE